MLQVQNVTALPVLSDCNPTYNAHRKHMCIIIITQLLVSSTTQCSFLESL